MHQVLVGSTKETYGTVWKYGLNRFAMYTALIFLAVMLVFFF